MKKILSPIVIACMLLVGSVGEKAQATGIYCHMSGHRSSCQKTDQLMNFQHRHVDVCNDGLGDFGVYGPWRLTLQYSVNYSSTWGCPSGTVLRYHVTEWRRV